MSGVKKKQEELGILEEMQEGLVFILVSVVNNTEVS